MATTSTSNIERARELMLRSRDEHFAVGAFNVDNQETLLAIVRAAQAKESPALVEVSHDEVSIIGLANMRSMVDNYREEYGVELYINLDHSPSVQAAKAGIDAGFEFVHIDYSQANRNATEEQIIAATVQAIDYGEIRKPFSTPEGASAFVAQTGVDTYAAAVGNLHGRYPAPKALDLELPQRIRDAVDCNISLHGGRGTPGDFF